MPVRAAILANVPVWTLPGLEHLKAPGHYCTWLEPLIPEFEKHQEVEMHWITMSKEATSPIEHRAYGQTFHVLPRGKKSVSMATGYLAEVLAIRNVLRSIDPHVLQAWGNEDVYGWAGGLSGVRARIFSMQGSLSHYWKLLGGSLLFRLQVLYEKPAIRRYHFGTAESPLARDLMAAIHPSMEIQLVDYGVNPAFFDARWMPSEKPVVVFLGSVTKRKGIIDLIEAAQSPELSHLQFKILGSGELMPSLKLISPPNVEWLGQCTRSAIIEHLATAWCLVSPTYADTGPTVIKEARVIGLPIVTTTGAGASCYVEDGLSGYVLEPGDVPSLISALRAVCVSRDHCLSMGQAGWPAQRAALHPAVTAEKLTALYLLHGKSV